MAATESEKAKRYIELLDSARCNARWDEIPELTRKVAKHAPHRTCLVLTAQTEAQVAAYHPPDRPPTATSSSLAKLITPLLAAIDAEQAYKEDAFQATVCLGWIHWVLQEPLLATSRLPKYIIADITAISETSHRSKAWVQVCAMKAGYIKGFSQEKTSGPTEGLETYKSLVPLLVSLPSSLGSYSPEFRLWTERMLSRMVAVTMRSKPLGEWLDLESMLQMFHLWISLFRSSSSNARIPGTAENTRQPPSVVELGSEVDYSRWDVWMAYYQTLSEVLLLGYIYAPTYSDKHPELLEFRDEIGEEIYISCRLRQRAELKRVEASIETKLLEETRFPKATERNSRVERWADAVMRNWQILCGPTWRDEELGEGGKSAIARGVLDTLYRAATKSFHSTQILRYLFNVHAYVTEYDLAFKAFDTYVELVQKGKDREDKTGEPDYSLDNDDITLHTVSDAIKILCRFGDRKDVEKARQVSIKLRRWVEKAAAAAEAQESADTKKESLAPIRVPVSPASIAEAYRALGLCEATWAHLTFDAGARNGHQQKAVEYFRTSLNMSFGNGPDLETSFALAFVLAEMRELSPAIKVVKQAIARPARGDFSSSTMTSSSLEPISRSGSTDYARERKLIPFWHLLTLLLTAKADLATAARTSNAAFEQFGDEEFLFGADSRFKSEHLQELEKPEVPSHNALVDHMERSEKESIIQVKLTQIALKEALHGAADAVDSSAELLALYARLFGDPRDDLRAPSRLATSNPPKSAVGSLRHSVFGRVTRSRSRHGRKPDSIPPVPDLPGPGQSNAISTSTLAAPTIQITTEDGNSSVARHKGPGATSRDGSLFRTKSHHGGSGTLRKTPSVKHSRRSRSQSRKSLDSSRPTTPHDDHHQSNAITTNEISPTPAQQHPGPRSESKISNFSLPRPSTSMSDTKVSNPGQPLRTIPHNLDPLVEPPPIGHREHPLRQDVRLPAPHPASGKVSPEPIFPVIQKRRQRVSLLVELWLFIAGLYTRAAVFDDAKAAIDEAGELVTNLEAQLAVESSSAKAFSTRHWSGTKSIEELWGDVWAIRGDLLLSQTLSYEAISSYEKALSHFPDHPTAIVGLSSLLLEVANKTIEPEIPEPPLFPDFHNGSSANGKEALQTNAALSSKATDKALSSATPATAAAKPTSDSGTGTIRKEPSPSELNRLAARDRAYALLNSLTKLGSGWDCSEAWFALARSYELSGQIEKAKEVLWWCVELEDTRPLRQWSCVRAGGF